MKRLLYRLVTLFSLLLPGIVWADSNNILNPDALNYGTDVSVQYLQDIFGVIDGVLHGSGSQIMGHMFAIFNSGALFLGAVILGYTTIVGTLNTANEGEFLGREWSSIWIPVRSAIGIVLLLPRATGYSTIQVLMMWVIVQGVGLADSVWNSALGYLNNGGVLVQQPLALDMANVGGQVADIFRSEVCMFTIQNAMRQAYNNAQANNNPIVQGVPYPPNLLNTVIPIGQNSTSVVFPTVGVGNNYDLPIGLNGICGTVNWEQPSSQNNSNNSVSAEDLSQVGEAQVLAVQQVILDLAGPAKALADIYLPPTNTPSVLPNLPTISSSANSYFANLTNRQSFLNFFSGSVPPTLIADATSDYQGIMLPLLQSWAQATNQSVGPQTYANLESGGWILAGSYYWQLSSVNAVQWNSAKAASTFAANGRQNTISGNLNNNLSNALPTYASSYATKIQNLFSSPSTPYELLINALTTQANTMANTYGGRQQPIPQTDFQAAGDVGILPFGPLVNIFTSFSELAQLQQTDENPVVVLAFLGSNVINLVVQIWITAAFAAAAITTALAAVPCVDLGTISLTLTAYAVPLLTTISVPLFVIGCLETFYIPLIPMIIFTFSALGWIIAVIEAMVAAPLVALGLTHPEGHKVVGRADQGLLLLVSVFLTPSMMIIGFIAGIILSFVGVWLLNQSFWGIFTPSIMAQYVSGFAWLFAVPALLMVYTYLVMAVLNQAFSLIHIIPDKVMRWVGAPSGVGIGEGAREAAGQAKEATQSYARDVGGAMKGASEGAGDTYGKKTKADDETAQKSRSQASLQVGESGKPPGGGP